MPQTYISGTIRRTNNRRNNPQGKGTAEKADARTAGNVRPYLLKRFTPKKSEDLRNFPRTSFENIRNNLISIAKNNGIKNISLPNLMCNEFFEKASDMLEMISDTCINDIRIIDFNGIPRIEYTEEAGFWEMDCGICIGAIDYIKNRKLKNAVIKFMRAFTDGKTNPFVSAYDTAWAEILNEFLFSYVKNGKVTDEVSDQEQAQSMYDDYKTEIRRFLCEKKRLLKLINRIKTTKKPESQKELIRILNRVTANNDAEKELLELLKNGTEYIFSSNWNPQDIDNDDNYYGTSVTVCPYDYFPIYYSYIPLIFIGNELIEQVFQGDSTYNLPMINNVIEDDGTEVDIYDRHGFMNFCNDLTKVLSQVSQVANDSVAPTGEAG